MKIQVNGIHFGYDILGKAGFPVVLISDVGHMPMLEKPEALSQGLKSLIHQSATFS